MESAEFIVTTRNINENNCVDDIMSLILYILCCCGQIQSADWTETPGLGSAVDRDTEW